MWWFFVAWLALAISGLLVFTPWFVLWFTIAWVLVAFLLNGALTHILIRKRQRGIDLEILWPSVRERAPTIAVARDAMRAHMLRDSAWEELDHDEIEDVIAKLH